MIRHKKVLFFKLKGLDRYEKKKESISKQITKDFKDL